MTSATNENSVARKFNTANPIEFDFYNEDDEHVLYITDDYKQLKSLTLKLKNTSPRDIELQTPDSDLKPTENGRELTWDNWQASKDHYHFQLSFRPGLLSEKAKGFLKSPDFRESFLDEGWGVQYDQNKTDLTDWVSFLWVESGQSKLLKKGDSLELFLTKLSAGPGGGARGTRVHLNYRHLIYQDRKATVPAGTRTQFLNIVNHRGKQHIPLHVGIVGSNTILNDGKTVNELTLRITNTSHAPIPFARMSDSNASRISISFDLTDDHEAKEWALTSEDNAAPITLLLKKEDSSIVFDRGPDPESADSIYVTTKYLNSTPDEFIGDWTFTAWVLPRHSTAGGVIYTEGEKIPHYEEGENNYDYQEHVTLSLNEDGKLQLSIRKSRVSKIIGPALNFDEWNFVWITARKSDGTIRIGVNDKVLEKNKRYGRKISARGEARAAIGSYYSTDGEYSDGFHGQIEKLSLWGKAHSKEGIGRIKDSGCTGNEPDLLAYWPLDAIKNGKVKNLVSADGFVRGKPKIVNELVAVSETEGNKVTWSFDCVDVAGDQLTGGESFDLTLTEIRSSAPTGYANLYLHYEDIPGYWDGQIVCLIEKSPLVTRKGGVGHGDVGIGTDMDLKQYEGKPTPKLHVDVSNDNQNLMDEKPAAVFDGGNVGIGTKHPKSKLAVTDGLTIGAGWVETEAAPQNGLLVEGNVGIGMASGKARLEVKGATADENSSALNLRDSEDTMLFSVRNDGNVGIGTHAPANKLTVAGGMAVGVNYTATQNVAPNGILVEGNVGIGSDQTKPTVRLHVTSEEQYVAHFKGKGTDAGIVVETMGGEEAFIEFRKKKVEGDENNSNAWMLGIDDDQRLRIARVSNEMEPSTPESTYALDIRAPVTNQNLRQQYKIPKGNSTPNISKKFTLACKADILFLVQFDKLRLNTEEMATISMELDTIKINQIDVQLHFHHGGAYAFGSPSLHCLEKNVLAGSHTIELIHSSPSMTYDSCLLTIIQL